MNFSPGMYGGRSQNPTEPLNYHESHLYIKCQYPKPQYMLLLTSNPCLPYIMKGFAHKM